MLDRFSALVADRPRRFLQWWGGELAACLPTRLPVRLGLDRPAVWVSIGHSAAKFRMVRGEGNASVAEIVFLPDAPEGQVRRVQSLMLSSGAGQAKVGILLPPSAVLRPTVRLPSAARENLDEVLGFEMDRHTPFRAEQVYHDFRTVALDREADQLVVELAVAQRAEVDRALSIAAAWNLPVDRVAVEDARDPAGVAFNLLPERPVRKEGRGLRRVLIAQAAVICLLAVAAVYLPLQQKIDAIDATEARLTELQAEAAEITELKQQISDLAEQISFLADQKRSSPSATALLAEVTEILPDHTWLTELSWRGEDLRLVGYSQQPLSLIALVEDSDAFAQARFGAPVTMDPRLNLERFNIAASLEGEAKPE
jgi:general secretion pathway protein L